MSNYTFTLFDYGQQPDFHPVGDIYQKSHQLKGHQGGDGPDKNEKIKQMTTAVEKGNAFFVLGYHADTSELCAMAFCERYDTGIRIVDVGSTTEKGTGTGRDVVTVVFQKAHDEGLNEVTLEATNKSYQFYQKLDFEANLCPETFTIHMKNSQIDKTLDRLKNQYGSPSFTQNNTHTHYRHR